MLQRVMPELMGIKSMMKDFLLEVNATIHIDSSSAQALLHKQGPGRIKHLDTQQMWLQEKVRAGDFTVSRISTENNLADILTKNVPETVMNRHLKNMGVRSSDGETGTQAREYIDRAEDTVDAVDEKMRGLTEKLNPTE